MRQMAVVLASGAALADGIQGNGGDNRLVGINDKDNTSGSSGDEDDSVNSEAACIAFLFPSNGEARSGSGARICRPSTPARRPSEQRRTGS